LKRVSHTMNIIRSCGCFVSIEEGEEIEVLCEVCLDEGWVCDKSSLGIRNGHSMNNGYIQEAMFLFNCGMIFWYVVIVPYEDKKRVNKRKLELAQGIVDELKKTGDILVISKENEKNIVRGIAEDI
jgi:hypothetical protein